MLVSILIIVGAVAGIIWLTIWLAEYGVHSSFCTCPKCREAEIKRQVRYREWCKQQEEISKALDEIE